jgi:hypothetical protein
MGARAKSGHFHQVWLRLARYAPGESFLPAQRDGLPVVRLADVSRGTKSLEPKVR